MTVQGLNSGYIAIACDGDKYYQGTINRLSVNGIIYPSDLLPTFPAMLPAVWQEIEEIKPLKYRIDNLIETSVTYLSIPTKNLHKYNLAYLCVKNKAKWLLCPIGLIANNSFIPPADGQYGETHKEFHYSPVIFHLILPNDIVAKDSFLTIHISGNFDVLDWVLQGIKYGRVTLNNLSSIDAKQSASYQLGFFSYNAIAGLIDLTQDWQKPITLPYGSLEKLAIELSDITDLYLLIDISAVNSISTLINRGESSATLDILLEAIKREFDIANLKKALTDIVTLPPIERSHNLRLKNPFFNM